MTRTALVTGGTRGIGAAISIALKEAGFRVVANYVGSDERAKAFNAETGIPVYKWNVGDFAATAENIARIAEENAPIDVLVSNAGITRDATIGRMTEENWREVIDVNLTGTFNLVKAVFPGMRERGYGRIVSISSVNGQAGQIGQTNYSASKAGVIGFTKALALEGARYGVTANVVAPGYVDTDMVAAVPEKVMEGIIAKIPVGRLGRADEIARAVLFLAGENAGFVTGSTLSVNGGQYMD
ncbi:MAG: acetoacetyl-CoA reductase [Sphingomonadaceae bacterium]